jgi:hypothetical protein
MGKRSEGLTRSSRRITWFADITLQKLKEVDTDETDSGKRKTTCS